jgi:hypothetical protein
MRGERWCFATVRRHRRPSLAAILLAGSVALIPTAAANAKRPALAARRPSASLAIPAPRITIGTGPVVTYGVRGGQRAVLQRQFGTGRVYETVAVLPVHGGTVTAPRLSVQGRFDYRVVVYSRNRMVAISPARPVFSYATVALTAVFSTAGGAQCPGGVVDIGTQPFTADFANINDCEGDGYIPTAGSGTVNLLTMASTTCRSINLTIGGMDTASTGGVASVTVAQENADPVSVSVPAASLVPFTATLTGAAWQLQDATVTNGSNGDAAGIALSGSLSCYTPSGV